MVIVSEEREADVGEDKVLGKEVDELKHFLGSPPGLQRKVDVCVVGLHNPTEQNSHNTCSGQKHSIQ